MYVTFDCPRCQHSNRSQEIAVRPELACAACDWSRPVSADQLEGDRSPRECLRCGNGDLWRQKNFPAWAGLLCVATGAITSSIAWGYHRPELALGILMGFALLDMILYMTMPDVLVCYRCQTRHHQADFSRNAAFNHELAERYRQERIRLQRSTPSTPAGDPLSSSVPFSKGQ